MKVEVWMNLFESFDPSSYYVYKFQFNWIFAVLPIMFLCNNYRLIPSRAMTIMSLSMSLIFSEFYVSIGSKKLSSNLIFFMGTMFYLMLLNFFSLFPYIFPATSHLMFNLSVSLSMFVALFIFSIYDNSMKFFAHLVPFNSPKPLMNFMVIIELISYFIRPMTLAIRLSSNLISGHLILILLSNFMMNFLYLMLVSIMTQNTLLILEISMSVIQAYVFSVLMTLYFKESN